MRAPRRRFKLGDGARGPSLGIVSLASPACPTITFSVQIFVRFLLSKDLLLLVLFYSASSSTHHILHTRVHMRPRQRRRSRVPPLFPPPPCRAPDDVYFSSCLYIPAGLSPAPFPRGEETPLWRRRDEGTFTIYLHISFRRPGRRRGRGREPRRMDARRAGAPDWRGRRRIVIVRQWREDTKRNGRAASLVGRRFFFVLRFARGARVACRV